MHITALVYIYNVYAHLMYSTQWFGGDIICVVWVITVMNDPERSEVCNVSYIGHYEKYIYIVQRLS